MSVLSLFRLVFNFLTVFFFERVFFLLLRPPRGATLQLHTNSINKSHSNMHNITPTQAQTHTLIHTRFMHTLKHTIQTHAQTQHITLPSVTARLNQPTVCQLASALLFLDYGGLMNDFFEIRLYIKSLTEKKTPRANLEQ
jgi:hypothetical protein